MMERSRSLFMALNLFLFLFLGYASHANSAICPAPWKCVLTPLKLQTTSVWTYEKKEVSAVIRSGYLEADPAKPFKGNVIYYEGLGDSMLNHMPLFKLLTDDGFRVIAFDYMGQGGSTGSMNRTRISEIANLGQHIWNLHARDLAQFPHRTIIGWSTGGLAAYYETTIRPDIKTVVLIAPGIAPNMIVGEQRPFDGGFDLITLASLTTQSYEAGALNPHLDVIRPKSPLKVPSFAVDLSRTARTLRRLGYANQGIPTFVLLSGDEDTYVNANETREFFESDPAHRDFVKIEQYPHTLHEIDNEAEPSGPRARQDILDFINGHR